MTLLDIMHGVLPLCLPLGMYYLRQDRRKGVPFSSFTVRTYATVAVGVLGVVIVFLRLFGLYSPPA